MLIYLVMILRLDKDDRKKMVEEISDLSATQLKPIASLDLQQDEIQHLGHDS